jgi:hypothetical protein
MLQRLEQQPNFLFFIPFSDESTFKSNSVVNRHNIHYWSTENSRWVRYVDRQRVWSINVWGGIIGHHVIGPHFLNGNLNREMYLNVLQNEFRDMLDDIPVEIVRRMFFMQDGAPPHFAVNVRRYLDHEYRQRWIGRGGPIAWLPRSPDLTPCDYFLWGYIKAKVFIRYPSNNCIFFYS